MTVKKRKDYHGNQHWVRTRKIKNNPKILAFVDVESKKIKNTRNLIFKMGCAIFYIVKSGKKTKITFYKVKDFWINLLNLFDCNNHKIQDLHLFAHNTQFDFQQLDGWRILTSLGWKINFRAVDTGLFIVELEHKTDKLHYRLHVWDTMNYVKLKLEDIGELVGLPKLKIDFDKCTDKELEIYCMRDTEIIFRFVKQVINFLEKYNLTELRATAASMAMNCYKINHYHPDESDLNTRISIHSWEQAIKIERKSYKGGITEVFRHGQTKEKLYYLDFNSQYPWVMRNCQIPIRLLRTFYESNWSQDFLFKFYNYFKKDYLFILVCSIYLPEESAYITNKFLDSNLHKNVFSYTEKNTSIEMTLTSPELDFVEENGKILEIHDLQVYAKGNLFKEYVDFFYNLKVKFGNEGNKVFREICKLFLNSFYGKWGQRKIITKPFFFDTSKLRKEVKAEVILNLGRIIMEKNLTFEDLKTQLIYITRIYQMDFWLVNGIVEYIIRTQQNYKESFVAIPSFITGYARMMLIEHLLIAKRENVYYCDTDSLIVNEIGYQNLKKANKISSTKLGFLKLEKETKKGEISNFWGPKRYSFGSERKITGLKKDAVIIEETEYYIKAKQEKWKKYKTDFKEGIYNIQEIEIKEIVFSKLYDKGKVDKLGYVHPYSVSEIMSL